MMELTAITDISLLWSMPLELLAVRGSKVGDLSRVRELPNKHLLLDFDPAREVALLRSISTLEMVNHQQLQEFLTGSD